MNYYARAIDILDAVSGNHEKEHVLILEIAKKSPGALVNAEGALDELRNLEGMTAFERQIVETAKNNKITAIKELRKETGLGLKEAKAEVECLCEFGVRQRVE